MLGRLPSTTSFSEERNDLDGIHYNGLTQAFINLDLVR